MRAFSFLALPAITPLYRVLAGVNRGVNLSLPFTPATLYKPLFFNALGRFHSVIDDQYGANFITFKWSKMEKSFGLWFHLKKNKNPNDFNHAVYMRITVDGEYAEISTKRKCELGKWNVEAGRMQKKLENATEFNAYLDTLQQKVYEAKRKLLELDRSITPEAIKNLLLGKSLNAEKKMLIEIFQHHNDQVKALIGNSYSASTYERYKTSLKHTRSFLKWKYKIEDIDITKMDYEFISEYEFWLKSIRKCDHNSTMKYLGNFKKIINRCLKNGWLSRDPFLGFSMAKVEVERTALTEIELQKLTELRFSTERLQIVRDIFLFSCYSGLAYIDVKKLKKSEIVIGMDGDKWILTHRQKTKIPTRVPMLPAASTLVDTYKNHPQCLLDDKVLPVLSNQKMNAYLKEIADLAGISKSLTYHIARHTFATTVTLSNGVPIETVSKMLGHRNLRTTQHYAKILDMKVSADMKGIKEKYI